MYYCVLEGKATLPGDEFWCEGETAGVQLPGFWFTSLNQTKRRGIWGNDGFQGKDEECHLGHLCFETSIRH